MCTSFRYRRGVFGIALLEIWARSALVGRREKSCLCLNFTTAQRASERVQVQYSADSLVIFSVAKNISIVAWTLHILTMRCRNN